MTFQHCIYYDITRMGAPRVLYCRENIKGVPYEWGAILGSAFPLVTYLAVAQRAFDRARKAA